MIEEASFDQRIQEVEDRLSAGRITGQAAQDVLRNIRRERRAAGQEAPLPSAPKTSRDDAGDVLP